MPPHAVGTTIQNARIPVAIAYIALAITTSHWQSDAILIIPPIIYLALSRRARAAFANFILLFCVPFAAMSLLVSHFAVIGENTTTGNSPQVIERGILYLLRFALLGTVFQATLLTIAPADIIPALRSLRIPKSVCVVFTSAMLTIAETREIFQATLTTARSRGYGIDTNGSKIRAATAALTPIIGRLMALSEARAFQWYTRGLFRGPPLPRRSKRDYHRPDAPYVAYLVLSVGAIAYAISTWHLG